MTFQQSLDAQNCLALARRRSVLLISVVTSLLLLLALIQLFYPSTHSLGNFLKTSSSSSSKDHNHHHTPPVYGGEEGGAHGVGGGGGTFNGIWDTERDQKKYQLSDRQCRVAFPGLFDEVERGVAERRVKGISFEEVDGIPRINGYVRGMIFDQDLYIIDTQGGIYSRELATLHALYRAITTSPEPLPNIEFTFISDDRISSQATWTYARRAEDTALWLMPDFGYWSWPETKVGSYGEVRLKAQRAEAPLLPDVLSEGEDPLPPGSGWNWDRKHDKLVWRGATMGLEVREKFINETEGKDWADVRAVRWHDDDSMRDDLLSMDAHCHYKFLAHTEGNSYSGRLKYLQSCHSVIVAHTMDWIQHFQPLMQSSGPDQNYVEVKRDFSDLESTMRSLLDDPDKARRIADNSVRTFRDRYLTPAAEACYWRRLVRGWREVSFEPEFWNRTSGLWRGVPWESYALERRLDWAPY